MSNRKVFVCLCFIAFVCAWLCLQHSIQKTFAAPRAFVRQRGLDIRPLNAFNNLDTSSLQAGDAIFFSKRWTRPFGEYFHSVALCVDNNQSVLTFQNNFVAILPANVLLTKLNKKNCAIRRLACRSRQSSIQKQFYACKQNVKRAADTLQGKRLEPLKCLVHVAQRAFFNTQPPNDLQEPYAVVCSSVILEALVLAGFLDSVSCTRSPDELLFADAEAGVPIDRRWSLPWTTASGAFWTEPTAFYFLP